MSSLKAAWPHLATACAVAATAHGQLDLASAHVEWDIQILPPNVELLPVDALETSIRFLENRQRLSLPNRLWIWPQRFTTEVVTMDPPPPFAFNTCRYDAASAAPVEHAGAFLVYTVLSNGAIASSEWVSTVDPPSELLWPSSSLFIDDTGVAGSLFSYGGFTVVNQTSGCVDDAEAGFDCSSCGIGVCSQGITCLQPSLRTHLFDLNTRTWRHYSFNATGRSAPRNLPSLRYTPDGTFALGLVYAYDPVRRSVLAVGGEQYAPSPPGQVHVFAPAFAFSLLSLQWQMNATQGCRSEAACPDGFPNTVFNSRVGSCARVFDSQLRRMLFYNGRDLLTVHQSGDCYALDVDSLTWTETITCSWNADVAPFFLFDAAAMALQDVQASLWLGGRLGDGGSSVVIPNQAGWILDASNEAWIPSRVSGNVNAFSAAGALPFTLQRSDLWLHSMEWDGSGYVAIFLAFGGTMANKTVNVFYSNAVSPCSRLFGGDYAMPDFFIARPDFFHVIQLRIPVAQRHISAHAGALGLLALLIGCCAVAIAAFTAVTAQRWIPSVPHCATTGNLVAMCAVDIGLAFAIALWIVIYWQAGCFSAVVDCHPDNTWISLVVASLAFTVCAHIAACVGSCCPVHKPGAESNSVRRALVVGDRARHVKDLARPLRLLLAPSSIFDARAKRQDQRRSMPTIDHRASDRAGLSTSLTLFDSASDEDCGPQATFDSSAVPVRAEHRAWRRWYGLAVLALHIVGATSMMLAMTFTVMRLQSREAKPVPDTGAAMPYGVFVATTFACSLMACGVDCAQIARVISGNAYLQQRRQSRRVRRLRLAESVSLAEQDRQE